jgi:hypothetical protein
MQAVMDRGGHAGRVARTSQAPTGPVQVGPVPGSRRPDAGAKGAAHRLRAWTLGTAFIVCGVGMIPWLAFLAVSLPSATEVPHWSLAWVGLDSMEAVGLFTTGLLIRRGDPRRSLTAMATAVLLTVDAWFDITTSASGGARTEAIVMAAFAEIPMAVICTVIAYRSLHRADSPDSEIRSDFSRLPISILVSSCQLLIGNREKSQRGWSAPEAGASRAG